MLPVVHIRREADHLVFRLKERAGGLVALDRQAGDELAVPHVPEQPVGFRAIIMHALAAAPAPGDEVK